MEYDYLPNYLLMDTVSGSSSKSKYKNDLRFCYTLHLKCTDCTNCKNVYDKYFANDEGYGSD